MDSNAIYPIVGSGVKGYKFTHVLALYAKCPTYIGINAKWVIMGPLTTRPILGAQRALLRNIHLSWQPMVILRWYQR